MNKSTLMRLTSATLVVAAAGWVATAQQPKRVDDSALKNAAKEPIPPVAAPAASKQ
jgi:hypothetical protein